MLSYLGSEEQRLLLLSEALKYEMRVNRRTSRRIALRHEVSRREIARLPRRVKVDVSSEKGSNLIEIGDEF